MLRPGGFTLGLFAWVAACAPGGSLLHVDGLLPPEAEALTITVLKTRVIESQAFALIGRPLPQTIALDTAGQTRGELVVVAQATVGDRVVAAGWTRVQLGEPGSLHLAPACATDGCRCTRTDCRTAGAACGVVQDGCGGVLDCGGCQGASTCAANGGGLGCGTGTCTPVGCPDGACGLLSDGCGGAIACMPCGS